MTTTTTATRTIAPTSLDLDARLDAMFGPASPATQAWITASLSIHEAVAAGRSVKR